MNKKIKTEAVDHLFDAILKLQSKEECYSFFEDLCTVNELLSLSQRFEVASMLRDRKTYLEIAEKTGASTANSCAFPQTEDQAEKQKAAALAAICLRLTDADLLRFRRVYPSSSGCGFCGVPRRAPTPDAHHPSAGSGAAPSPVCPHHRGQPS